MKCSVFIATSLDGFIAREDGGIDWLPGPEVAGPDEDFGYQDFFGAIDAIVMGRNTFELLLTFNEWYYGETPLFVLSSREIVLPQHLPTTVSRISGPPAEVVRLLEERGLQHLYVDGGRTIQEFLRSGLIDEMTITRIPVLLGNGVPLFGSLESDIRLRHIETRSFPGGIVQSRYAAVKRDIDVNQRG